MDDPAAIWREALKDSQHPRHQTAWLLFVLIPIFLSLSAGVPPNP